MLLRGHWNGSVTRLRVGLWCLLVASLTSRCMHIKPGPLLAVVDAVTIVLYITSIVFMLTSLGSARGRRSPGDGGPLV